MEEHELLRRNNIFFTGFGFGVIGVGLAFVTTFCQYPAKTESNQMSHAKIEIKFNPSETDYPYAHYESFGRKHVSGGIELNEGPVISMRKEDFPAFKKLVLELEKEFASYE